MSNTTDPENLPPRRNPEENRSGSYRDGTYRDDVVDGEPTRTYERVPTERVERVPAEPVSADQEPAAYAERDYVPASDNADSRLVTPVVDPRLTDPRLTDRQTAVAREKEQFGGIKVGSAFFGWLTATGMSVLLTALVAAAGTGVGLATTTDVGEAVNEVTTNGTVGLVGIIVLLVILFVSYYSGGYVAGRMARFNGAKQGLMVWIWALIAAVVVALLGLLAGQQFNILANLNSFPRIPINEGQLSTVGIVAAAVVAVVALAGAVLGGLAGMRFHRKVDRAGFTPDESYSES